jgi:hypothetical protein
MRLLIRSLALVLPVLLVALLAAAVALGNTAAPNTAAAPRLLALAYNKQTNSEIVGTVNLTTGQITPLGAGLPDCCMTAVLDAALDSAGGRYFAVMSQVNEAASRLITFNTSTGAAAISPSLATTLTVIYLAYDSPSGQLLALATGVQALPEPQLVFMQPLRIDPATAAVTPLGSPLADCCSPKAHDAAYDQAARRLYTVLQPDTGSAQLRLVTISGVDGSVAADIPITSTLDVTELEIDHLAYDPAAGTLWALINDVNGSAQRLARIDPATGVLTPLGAGIASCCARMVTDVALDTANQVLVAPMIDTTDPLADDVPTFFRFALGTGALLDSTPVDPDYDLHYIALEQAATTPPTPTRTPTPPATVTVTVTVMPTGTPTGTPSASLYLPRLQRGE